MDNYVNIRATSERYARLKHPLSNLAAGTSAQGVRWPHDQFTYRRIEEGSIEKVTEPVRLLVTGKRKVQPRVKATRITT